MSRKQGLGVGSVSLIMIFSVLCLTVFCLVTLSTARSDASLAQRAAQSVSAYYAADTEAERVYAELNSELKSGSRPDRVRDTDISYKNGCASYTCAVDETHFIAVVVAESGEVIEWAQTDDGSWTPDESIAVWGSEQK